jgi:GTP cyclohydrolase I
MNIYDPELDRKPGRDEAEAALAVLKRWADRASAADIVALDPAVGALLGAGYPVLNRAYPDAFWWTRFIKTACPTCKMARPA